MLTTKVSRFGRAARTRLGLVVRRIDSGRYHPRAE
jgi:hypothetical protein